MSVVAKATCRVAGPKAKSMIVKGKVYDENSPIVKARPELFEPVEDYQRRASRPRGTQDLGNRSMSARKRRAPAADAVETARQAPGEKRAMDYPCEVEGCDWSGTSVRSLKIHRTKVHS